EKSRLISEPEPLNRQWLANEVRTIQPSGTTPLAYALQRTQEDLVGISETQLLLLVSDGMETCGGDPVQAARDLVRAGYNLRIHVVGFDVRFNTAARQQLIEIAESTGGAYFDAQNSDELRQALSLAAPFSYTVYDATGNVAFVGRLGEDGPELAPGTYSVVIDTSPPTVINNVIVTERQTTLITVQQSNGGYQAEIE
ncbi:VWA domain-containing protein, partial [Candidatus Bipolaricaulota bacterium]|nr:VWA domain-containing protein [Candidatus Bipolaricaulota bacterium]